MCYMIFFYQKRENWQLMGKLLWREEKEDGRLGELGSAFWWDYFSLQGVYGRRGRNCYARG